MNRVFFKRVRLRLFQLILLISVGAVLGVIMREARFDDPFITYRFAENVASGHGFSFNPNEVGALITTSPLYALLLGALRCVGFDVPTTSYNIGVVSIIIGALAIQHLNWSGKRWLGFLGGLLYLLMPLNWLTLGFETPLFLALLVINLHLLRGKKIFGSGIICGIMLGLRGDALMVIACSLATWVLVSSSLRRWQALRDVLLSKFFSGLLIAYAPLAIFLILRFGSPLPTTLATKTAQAASGLTGFYTDTNFIQGLGILMKGAFDNSILFACLMLFPVIGIFTLLINARAFSQAVGLNNSTGRSIYFVSEVWLVLYAILHIIGYSLLGVAPYVWYYAPLLPGIAVALANFIESIAESAAELSGSKILKMAVQIGPLAFFVVSLAQMTTIWAGATPPPPHLAASKVLPESKVVLYQKVGEWLNANTPDTATVGFTELGVMSYYAQRHAVDFLGLTSPQYRDAIRRGDYAQSLLHEQPDYIALSAVNSIYTFNPQDQDWFKLLYKPVQVFDDARFWGTPMTVFQRVGAPLVQSILLDNKTHDLGEGWAITGIAAHSKTIKPNEPFLVRLRLRAGPRLGYRTLRVQPVLISGGDGLPVASRLINTNLFRQGEEAWLDFQFVPKAYLSGEGYVIHASWMEGGPTVAAGFAKVPFVAQAPALVAPLNFGAGIGVLGSISGCANARQALDMVWVGGDIEALNYTAFVHMRNAENKPAAQADGPPREGHFPTSVWSRGEVIPDARVITLPAQAGEYSLVVGLYVLGEDVRLPVQDSPYKISPDEVKIGTITVSDCGD